MMAAVPLTDLERSLQAWHRRRLVQQRSRLKTEVADMVASFDAALATLRRDKFRLEKELKTCEMRQLVFAQVRACMHVYGAGYVACRTQTVQLQVIVCSLGCNAFIAERQ
jgi:hypothetical protein